MKKKFPKIQAWNWGRGKNEQLFGFLLKGKNFGSKTSYVSE